MSWLTSFTGLQSLLWKDDSFAKELKKLAEMPEVQRAVKLAEARAKLVAKHRLPQEVPKLGAGTVGLNNMGNTCYLNSVLQCLAHCPELRELFLRQEWWAGLNPLSSPTRGELACEFFFFLLKYWTCARDSFSPSGLKPIISKAKSSFAGWDQHDAQELLTYFLDSLHEDLNRVLVKPYRQREDFREGGDVKAFLREAFDQHCQRNQSPIVDIFHGQFHTKINCPESECRFESVVGDPFEVLSLTVPDCSPGVLPLYFLPAAHDGPVERTSVHCFNDHSMADVLRHFRASVPRHSGKRLKMFLYQRLRLVTEALERHMMAAGPLNDSEFVPMVCETLCVKTWALVFGDRAAGLLAAEWPHTAKIKVHQTFNGEFCGVERLLEVPDDATYPEIQLLLFLIFRRPFLEAGLSAIPPTAELPASREQLEREHEQFLRDLLNHKEALWRVSVRVETGDGLVKKAADDLFLSARNKTVKVTYQLDLQGLSGNKLGLRKTAEHPIGPMGPSGEKTLESCLDVFTKEEVLDPDNMWYCPRCKDHKMASRETLLNRVPPVLVIHLRRFRKVLGKRPHFAKMNAEVRVPQVLDVAPFMLQPAGDYRYGLFGVVNHFGNLSGGHYTAMARSGDGSGQWVSYDDEDARAVKADRVSSSAAYVLFYRRIEPTN